MSPKAQDPPAVWYRVLAPSIRIRDREFPAGAVIDAIPAADARWMLAGGAIERADPPPKKEARDARDR
jgi:hypothetical protein